MKSLIARAIIATALSGCVAPSGWAKRDQQAPPPAPPAPQPPQQQQAPPADVQVKSRVVLPDRSQAAPSNTRWAQTKIEITREFGLPKLDDVSTFVDSTAGQLAPQMVGLPREQLPQFFSLKPEQAGQTMELILTVNLPADAANVRPAAGEYLDRIVRELLTYLEQTRTASIDKRLSEVRENAAAAEQRVQSQTQEIRQLEKKLRDESGRVDVSPQNLMNAITQLDEEHMRLEIEQAAKLARRTALTKALADSRKEIEQRIKEDPVVAELEKVLTIRTEALKRKREMVEQGLMSKEEFAEAEAQVAEARAQLLERRQDAAQQAGADVINSWNRELLELSVDENEVLARLEQVNQRLNKMRTLLDSLNQLEDLQRRTEESRERLQESQSRLQEMAERLRELADRAEDASIRSKSAREAPKNTDEDND